jgi:hypothetical protein
MISSTVGGSAGYRWPSLRGATDVIAPQGRRRAPPTGGIEHGTDGHGISSQSHSGHSPLLYQRSRVVGNRRVRDRALSLRFGDAQAGAWSDGCPTLVRSKHPRRLDRYDRIEADRGLVRIAGYASLRKLSTALPQSGSQEVSAIQLGVVRK